MILALDPGETTGFAYTDGNELLTGSCKGVLGLHNTLKQLQPETIVCESYTLFPWKAQGQAWSTIPSAEMIGIVKLYTDLRRTILVMQAPSIKSNAQKKFDLKNVKCSNQHEKDAALHLLYYLGQKDLDSVRRFLK